MILLFNCLIIITECDTQIRGNLRIVDTRQTLWVFNWHCGRILAIYKNVVGLFAGTITNIIEVDGEGGKAATCTLTFFAADDRHACRAGNSIDDGLIAGYNIICWYIDYITFGNTVVGH